MTMRNQRLEIVKEWLRPTPDSCEDTRAIRGFTLQYIEDIEAEVRRLTDDLAANAHMLARQCDLAREAERKAMQAEAEAQRLRAIIRDGIEHTAHYPGCPQGISGPCDCATGRWKAKARKAIEEKP